MEEKRKTYETRKNIKLIFAKIQPAIPTDIARNRNPEKVPYFCYYSDNTHWT